MRAYIFIIFEIVFLFFWNSAHSQCDSLFLGNDVFVCEGDSIMLDAGEGYNSYLWNNGSTNQTIAVNEEGNYWCTVQWLDSTNNLVVNGAFSAGYLGFQSDYVMNNVSLYAEGTYAVTTNPSFVHPGFAPCSDHTTGFGKFMVVNGAPIPNQNVWFESIPLEPNTEYHYSGWFASVHSSNPAVMDMSINGLTIAQVNLSSFTCYWQNFYAVWNSGENTSADLQIVNQNTIMAGNDFSIDDISMYRVCTITDTINVEFAPNPIVNFGADTIICTGESLILNPGPFYAEYSWQDGSVETSFEVTQPGIYWVNVINNYGCHGGDTIQVDFAILPEIDLGPDTVLCEGESLVLDVDPSFAAYLWQDGSEESTYEVTQPGEYWVMVTNEIGCTGGDTIQVDFAILPDVNLGNDTTICEGDSLIIFAGDSYEYYEWQDGSSGQSYIAKEEGLYWVIVTLEGCTKKDSLYLSVEEATLPIYLGSDTTICKDEYITIGINPGVNLNYLWSTGDTTAAISIGQPGTYSLEVFGACGSSSDAITISNWPYPNPALGDDRFLCFGQFDYLIAAPGFYSYSWNNQSPTSDNEILVSETNYYYVEVEDYHGCIGYDTVFVEVGSIVELGEPTIDLCEGDSVVLDAGGEFDYYNWNGVAGSQTKTIFEGGIYKVEVGYSANAECTSEDQVTVNYFNLPVAVIISGDFLCEGDTLHLKAPIGSYTYYWNNEQSNNALFIVNSGGNYTLKLENVCGFDSTEKIIEQRSLPNVNLGEDRLLFPDESITLDAGVFESYEWNNDSNLNSQFYTVTSENAVDTSTIFVEVFDGLCYNKDDVFIEVFYVKIPAVITPNGDGDNDTFEPFEEGWAGIHEHTISVFNRWGEKVWESNDFPSGWDGKQNGRYVAEGTYYWILEVKYGPENLSKSYKGSLTVIGTGR